MGKLGGALLGAAAALAGGAALPVGAGGTVRATLAGGHGAGLAGKLSGLTSAAEAEPVRRPEPEAEAAFALSSSFQRRSLGRKDAPILVFK